MDTFYLLWHYSKGENAYIWVDLIIGFVTVVLNFLTTKSPAT